MLGLLVFYYALDWSENVRKARILVELNIPKLRLVIKSKMAAHMAENWKYSEALPFIPSLSLGLLIKFGWSQNLQI